MCQSQRNGTCGQSRREETMGLQRTEKNKQMRSWVAQIMLAGWRRWGGGVAYILLTPLQDFIMKLMGSH